MAFESELVLLYFCNIPSDHRQEAIIITSALSISKSRVQLSYPSQKQYVPCLINSFYFHRQFRIETFIEHKRKRFYNVT